VAFLSTESESGETPTASEYIVNTKIMTVVTSDVVRDFSASLSFQLHISSIMNSSFDGGITLGSFTDVIFNFRRYELTHENNAFRDQ
jgi:hypothetical protein